MKTGLLFGSVQQQHSVYISYESLPVCRAAEELLLPTSVLLDEQVSAARPSQRAEGAGSSEGRPSQGFLQCPQGKMQCCSSSLF
jgi:hypothetical protein